MIRQLLFTALAAAVFASTQGESVQASGSVHVLGSDNFTEVLSADSALTWMVEFYAPWCGHCKTLAPEYAKAASDEKLDARARLAMVDGTEHSDLASKYEVEGFPTLLIFKGGSVDEPVNYEGGRTASAIIADLNVKADPKWKPPPDRVVTLTNENFDSFIASEKLTLVEFYAPWCGHCKKLEPEYKKAAQYLWKHKIKIAKVDATAEADLASRYGIAGYPTLKLFSEGVASDFDAGGEQNADSIISEILGQIEDPAEILKSYFEADRLAEGNLVNVIGFFDAEATGSTEQLKKFQTAVKPLRKLLNLRYVSDPAIRQRFSGISSGQIAVFSDKRFRTKYEDAVSIKSIDTSNDELVEWIKGFRLPLVGWFETKGGQPPSQDDPYTTKRPLLIAYYDVDYSPELTAQTNAVREKIADLAIDYRGKLTFTIANEQDNENSLKKDFGLEDSDLEVKPVILSEQGMKFPMQDDMEMRDFVDAYLGGKLEPYIKSQPVPKKQGPVTTVVGRTFKSIVENPKKDVLIEFFAPWCGHCKSLIPKYKKLAKQLADVDGVEVAMMDATANDFSPLYRVEGFPTIYLVPKGENPTPILYDDARTVKAMLKFLRNNTSADIPELKKKKKSKDKEEL